ncbi:hypothetical protein INT44_006282 [Umbelopsis vinacea]|jgi:hypothetical protein|uniref:Uncharacterized protein n=1 Tax=Umbelopsis vinacea TaxID=44442 RepID=A0A8H7UBH0_9FUNG|nr:hypothetical protein INT44_006282 [Umbelopsis vinacea]
MNEGSKAMKKFSLAGPRYPLDFNRFQSVLGANSAMAFCIDVKRGEKLEYDWLTEETHRYLSMLQRAANEYI